MRFIYLFLLLLLTLSACRNHKSQLYSTKEPTLKIKAVGTNTYKETALNLINNAKHHIYLWMFGIANYREKKNPLLYALCQARKRGIDVKILIEGGEDFLGSNFYKKQKSAYEFLKGCGIDIRIDKKGKTTHVKMLLVDTFLLIGSTNWTYYGLEKNTELNVLINSAETDTFGKLFLKAFKRAKKNKFHTPNIPKNITLQGIVISVKEKISKRGNAYTLFKIKSNGKIYKVFMKGHHHIKIGEKLLVKGIFYKIKKVGKRTYYNEIEATYIRRL